MRHFKACGACRRGWSSWEEFLADPGLRLLGLQAVSHVPDASVLVFEHQCGSSVSVLTSRLHHLVPEPEPLAWPSLRGTDACARHCLDIADHTPCAQRCRHTADRQLLAMVERAKG